MEDGYYVFVVSDATGATGEMVLRAALTQFDTSGVVVERMAQVRTEEQIREVVRTVAQRQGLIVHTLVSARLREVMLTGDSIPLARLGDSMGAVLEEMDKKGLGAVLVLDGDERLVGIVTDGDLSRALLKFGSLDQRLVEEVMTKDPKHVGPDVLAADALVLMERYLITVLPVVGISGFLLGIVHLHDLLGKGQFKFTV